MGPGRPRSRRGQPERQWAGTTRVADEDQAAQSRRPCCRRGLHLYRRHCQAQCAAGRWLPVGEVYQRATREFAVEDSFERVAAAFAPPLESNGSNGSHGAEAEAEMTLSVEQLHRCRDTQADLENFVQAVRMAVAADQENRRLTSAEVVKELSLD